MTQVKMSRMLKRIGHFVLFYPVFLLGLLFGHISEMFLMGFCYSQDAIYKLYSDE